MISLKIDAFEDGPRPANVRDSNERTHETVIMCDFVLFLFLVSCSQLFSSLSLSLTLCSSFLISHLFDGVIADQQHHVLRERSSALECVHARIDSQIETDGATHAFRVFIVLRLFRLYK